MSDLQNTQLRKLLRNARMVKDNNARIVQTLAAQVDRLTAERDAWRKLVMEHNEDWTNSFNFCFADWRIDIPSELEKSP